MTGLLVCLWLLASTTSTVGAFHLRPTHKSSTISHSSVALSSITTPSSITGTSESPLSGLGKKKKKKTAVIVGGGPVGLAAALTLSNPPHCYDVKIIEQSKRVKSYDPTRAFLYNVNLRGQQWLSMFPSAMQKLQERGVVSRMDSLVVVPADPIVPIPMPKTAVSSLAGSDKNVTVVNVPAMASFWIRRHEMVDLLEETIEEEQKERKKAGRGKIVMISSKKCINLKSLPDGKVQVVVQDTLSPDTPFENFYTADLVVGADGVNSDVRGALGNDSYITKSSWVNMAKEDFIVRAWRSPASGLRMKVLQFPPGFPIPNKGGEEDITTTSQTMYAIVGLPQGPRESIRLGFLPVKSEKAVRTGNVILPSNHDLWKLKTGEECRDWFREAIPRLDWDNLIPPEEWDRFVGARDTIFPLCQYCPKLQVSPPGIDSGIVLVGDAIHSFPPDIGQGINAGLGDVVALDRALKGVDVLTGTRPKTEGDDAPPNTPIISEALREYERVRAPEIRALVRLARFGAPYQYNQPSRKDKLGKKLWKFNVATRLLLNKLSFGILAKPAILLTFGNNLTFRQAMRRADLTTAIILTGAIALLFPLLRILLRPMLV